MHGTQEPDSARHSRHILLVGFMGAGKSIVGRLLALRLGTSFVDLDSRIESVAGMSIAGIFEAEGEQGFRRREADATDRLVEELTAANAGFVVAVGGGVDGTFRPA